MDWHFEYTNRWTNGVATQHQVDLTLDLHLENFLDQPDFVLELLTNEMGIRRKICDLVVGKIVRQLVDESGLDATLSEEMLSTHAHQSCENNMEIGIPTCPHLVFYVRNQMHLSLTLDSSRPVNAMQALYAIRGGVATAIADNIITPLKRRFLRVDDSETHTECSVSGDTVTDIKHRQIRTSAQGN